jgi:hypothetical protein
LLSFIFWARVTPIRITERITIAFSFEVRFIDKDIVCVIHAIELEELVDELERHQRGRLLVDFLAERVLPEKGRVFSLGVLLLLDDLWLGCLDYTLNTLDRIWARSCESTPWDSRDWMTMFLRSLISCILFRF